VAPLYPQSVLAVENQFMRISVFADKGGLNEIIHKPSGVNLRNRANGASKGIWSMKLSSSSGSIVYVNSAKAATFKGALLADRNGSTLDLTWQGFSTAPNAVIHAAITLGDRDSAATWKWDAQNLAGLMLNWLIYPDMTGVGPLTAKDDVFIAPKWDGRVIRNPTQNKASYFGHYPAVWMNMQFIAFASPAVTFSLRAADAAGYSKRFDFNPTSSGAGDYYLRVWHYFDLAPTNRAAIPYDVVLSAIPGSNGDWTDAAEDYRKWAYDQPWAKQGRARSAPEWLPNIGASKLLGGANCNISTSPPQTIPQNASLLMQDQQALGAPLLGMLWGWEKYGCWFHGDYFPPNGGWEAFDAGALAAKQQGNRWYLLTSPSFVTASLDIWKTGALKSCVMLDENLKPILQADAHEYVIMDHSTTAWQAQVVNDATQLARHGVDVIHLDGFPRGPVGCFDPTHGHPVGQGGNWQSQAWDKLLAAVKTSVQGTNKEAVLGSEGTTELLLPWMTMAYSRDPVFESMYPDEAQLGWEPIPLFRYVYGPSTVFTGQNPYALTAAFHPDYQIISFGRALVWGQIPTYYYWPPGYRAAVNPVALSYLKKVVAARVAFARKYLISGSVLPPPAVQTPVFTATYFIGGSGNESGTKVFPAVQFQAWKAPDSDVGIAMTNTDKKAAQIQVPVNFKRLGLDPGSAYTACLLRASGSARLASASPPETTYGLKLDPYDVAVLELSTRPACRPIVGAPVNAASFAGGVAPGSLISLFGTDLAPEADQASTFPLPNTLRNFSATVNKIPVPLVYVSPTQVNAQLPYALSPGSATLTVRAGSADPIVFPITLATAAPGIFTFGANRAVAQNPDYSVNDKNNPAPVGGYLTVYLTGVGPFDNPVPDGIPTPSSTYSKATLPASATIGGVNAPIVFLGLTPGFVGLAQANIEVPKVLAGDHPLVITVGGVRSNSALVTLK